MNELPADLTKRQRHPLTGVHLLSRWMHLSRDIDHGSLVASEFTKPLSSRVLVKAGNFTLARLLVGVGVVDWRVANILEKRVVRRVGTRTRRKGLTRSPITITSLPAAMRDLTRWSTRRLK